MPFSLHLHHLIDVFFLNPCWLVSHVATDYSRNTQQLDISQALS